MLKKLEYFVAIAEEQNVTRAAEKMNITQPHLSRLIRSLEEELNTTLLVRTKKGVALTPAGELALEYSIGILTEVREMKNALSQHENEKKNTLVIASIESLIPLITRVNRLYNELYPNVEINIAANALSKECMEILAAGKADLAAIRVPQMKLDAYHQLEMGYEPWVAIFQEQSVLSQREGLVLANELHNLPLLLPYNDIQIANFCSWMKSSGFSPRMYGTWSTVNSAVLLTRFGVGGCAICPIGCVQIAKESKLKYRLLDPAVLRHPSLLVWKKTKEAMPQIVRYAELMEQQIKFLGSSIYRTEDEEKAVDRLFAK